MKRSLLVAVPALLLPLAGAALAWLTGRGLVELPDSLLAALPAVPVIALLVAALLCWQFNHSNAVIFLGLLAGAYALMRVTLTTAEETGLAAQILYSGSASLLPVTLLLLGLLSDRGLLTRPGLGRLAIVAVPTLGLLSAAAVAPLETLDFLNQRWDALAPLSRLLPITPLPQPAQIAFLLALLALGTRLYLRRLPLDAGYFAALLATGLAWHHIDDPVAFPSLASAAALALTVAAIQNSHRLAYLDGLTGLPSRRALEDRCRRLGRRYAIAMLDIDHFKKFNDTFGHDVGDQVLRMVASVLAEVGGGGRAYRYGGEEFTVIFRGIGAEDALEPLEALRQAVATRPFRVRSPDRPKHKPKNPSRLRGTEEVTITISIGVAERDEDNRTPDAVMKAADLALYRAKEKGRNRVSR